MAEKKQKSRVKGLSGGSGRSPSNGRKHLERTLPTWTIPLALSLIVAFLLYPQSLIQPRSYEPGDIADRDVKASREFLVENSSLTEKTRQEAVRKVLSVYDFEQTASIVENKVRTAFGGGRAFLVQELSSASAAGEGAAEPEDKSAQGREDLRDQFFGTLEIAPQEEVFDQLLAAAFPPEVEQAVVTLIQDRLNKGVVGNKTMLLGEGDKGVVLQDIATEQKEVVVDLARFYDLEEAKKFIRSRRSDLAETLGEPETAAALRLADALIKPNVTFNKRETALLKDEAHSSVKPFYFIVKKGEMLVREGERIGAEHLLKLSEHQRAARSRRMIGRVPAMAILIGALFLALHLVGLLQRRITRNRDKDMLFLAATLLTIFLLSMAASFVAHEAARGFPSITAQAIFYAVPVASGAMLVCVFQGTAVAAGFSLLAAVLVTFLFGARLELFVFFVVSGLIGAHGVRNCRERGIFIKTGLLVGLSNMALALSIQALEGTFTSVGTVTAGAAAFAGGILVGVIATGVLPLVEMAFGYTSDIKLLELSSLDQPLLRELMVRAPGTYHHSVIVSNMVEASAQAIQANPLLAKVAAYYHDIGKMSKPLYFIENQMDCENKHERLAPSMSSLILTSHVKDGVEMATKHKLGGEIVDIIQQHHGSSLITYFYRKAEEQKERKGGKSKPIEEEDFRYPGPKPQTKEAGLVMLADVVEAASRTVGEPTAARIQGMVQKIINKIFSDGQLNECELTLKDLNAIARSFNKTLSGILHQRIDYPEPVTKIAAARKGANGHSDQLAVADLASRKAPDQEEPREALRRLGLS